MLLRGIAVTAGVLALAGCATVDMMVDAIDVPPAMGMRMLPNEGVFLDQPRFRAFPADSVFDPLASDIRRPHPGEESSPMMRLRGVYRVDASGARFTDCNTDRVYPVAGAVTEERDVEEPRAQARAELQGAYDGARKEAGAPVVVSVDARYVLVKRAAAPGAEHALVVEKFDRLLPGTSCILGS